MRADEMAGRLDHRLDVEGVAMPQRGRGKERIGDRALEHGVDVQARPRRSPSVEALTCLHATRYGDARAQDPVQGGDKPADIELIRRAWDAYDLASSVNPRVGPPRAGGDDLTAEEAREGRLDVSLNRTDVRLACEAVKRSPVVGEVQPEVQDSEEPLSGSASPSSTESSSAPTTGSPSVASLMPSTVSVTASG